MILTLGDNLQKIEVKESSMDSCANISIITVNGLYYNSIYDHNDCTEEGVCQKSDDVLVGHQKELGAGRHDQLTHRLFSR
jgi:hypothetical protein